MRSALLPFTAWLGLQSLATPPSTLDQAVRLIGVASVLGSLTVLIYRLGVWRTEIMAAFDRIERRMDRFEGKHHLELLG